MLNVLRISLSTMFQCALSKLETDSQYRDDKGRIFAWEYNKNNLKKDIITIF